MRLPLAAVASVLLVASPSFADERQTCVTAHEHAQQERNAGKLVEARQDLTQCGRIECPELIRQDCTQWMTEIIQTLPTIIPAARDATGKDLANVRVWLDQKPVADVLDGRPLSVDPGIHQVRFESKNKTPVEQQIVVRQAEKNRIIAVTMEDAPAPAPAAVAQRRGLPVLGIVLGASGIVVGAVGLGLGISADDRVHDLRSTCAPGCSDGQVDDARSAQNVARVVGIVGGVLFATGVVLTVLHYTGAPEKSGRVRAMPSGAAVVF